MEKRVELEKRGRPAEEITELNLDNCRATLIEGLTDEFKNLESLSLINVGLTTLKGFPTLPNLRRLELSDNRIPGGLNHLQGSTKLQYLNLSGNKIKDIETLQPLQELKELKNLDLFNCEITNEENYREKVFELLEDLMYLDGYDRKGGEAEDDDEEGDENEDEEDDEDVEDGSEVIDVDDEEDDDEDEDDDDDEEEDDDDELDEDGEVDGEGGVGLDYLNKDDISDDEEGEDFDPEGDEPEGEEGEEDEEAGEQAEEGDEARGTKRKHDDDGEEDGA